MPRYIDSDALKKRMFNYYECVNDDTCKGNYRGDTLMDYEVADMIEDCIDNAPAADVEEVRHGEWLPSKYHYGFYECSECGRHIEERRDDPEVPYPYCHCGAKMDGERREK